jgi:hypothetical protein
MMDDSLPTRSRRRHELALEAPQFAREKGLLEPWRTLGSAWRSISLRAARCGQAGVGPTPGSSRLS